MGLDIQKASILKRISAGILDFILLTVLATGAGWLISLMCHYDTHYNDYNTYITHYAEEYEVDFNFKNTDEYKAMTEQDKAEYEARVEDALKALYEDEGFKKEYSLVIAFALMMTSLGVFIAFLVLEFIVPLLFKNGQTIGKKCFGIGVIHTNLVKVDGATMFIRAILGKYAIEVMIPLLIAAMIFFRMLGLVGTIILIAILVLEIVIFFATKTRSLIHDLLAKTVTVDLASQMVFTTQEEMIEALRQSQYEKEHSEYVPGSFSFDKTVDGEAIAHQGDIEIIDDDVSKRTDIVVDDDTSSSNISVIDDD